MAEAGLRRKELSQVQRDITGTRRKLAACGMKGFIFFGSSVGWGGRSLLREMFRTA